jgi:CHAT domain-containing protein/tetratricopeptide (TPR) repeat protein
MNPPVPARLFLTSLIWISLVSISSHTSLAQSDVHELVPGAPVERGLAGGESHFYRIRLTSAQHLRAVIRARDIDLAARIVAPNNRQLVKASTWNSIEQSAPLTLFVETPGEYRLEVYALGSEALPGRYELRTELAGTTTTVDRIRAAAERSFSEAEHARLVDTAESLDKTIVKYQDALQGWRELGDLDEEAETLHCLGLIYQYRQESKKSLEMYKQALALKRVINDRRGEATMLTNVGLAYWSLGEGQKALESYDEALLLRRVVSDRGGEGRTLNAIALFYWTMGENRKALDYYHRALALRRLAGDLPGQGITLHNIGLVYWTLAENQKALDYLAKALTVKSAVGDRSEAANTINTTGDVFLSAGEKLKALECYKQALSIHREIGSQVGEAEVLNSIGEAYLALGQPAAALASLEQSLSKWRWPDSSLLLFRMARAYRDLNQLEEARVRVESALDIVESIRTRVASPDVRISFSASTRNYYEFYIDLLMRLDARTPDAGYADLALQAHERARARGLLDFLTEGRIDIRQGVDPKLVEHERAVQQKLSQTSERLTRMLSGGPETAETDALNKEIESLVTEYQEAQGRIRAASPRYAGLTRPAPLNLKQIQSEVLDEDTLLLEYSLGKETSFLWVVTSKSIKSFRLPGSNTIESAARSVYELLTARGKSLPNETPGRKAARIQRANGETPQALIKLSKMLLGPAAAQLGTKRLLIASEGALQYVPFGALPVPTADRKKQLTNRDYRPLIVDHEVVSLPSASVLAALRTEAINRSPASKSLAVLADPVFTPNDPRIPNRSDGRVIPIQLQSGSDDVMRSAQESGLKEFVRLRFSRAEAEAIARFVPEGQKLEAVDFRASRDTATGADLSQYRIVHFATHGLINSQHPELSGLVLSLVDEKGQRQDGFLRLYEIYSLGLRADLVVLSACQTALGKEIKGEGLVGLTHGFMYAGAPRVVASLWRVDDRATAELMNRFYEGMLGKQKLTAAAALRAAQLEVWKEDGWETPYYWAAFTLQGEWR